MECLPEYRIYFWKQWSMLVWSINVRTKALFHAPSYMHMLKFIVIKGAPKGEKNDRGKYSNKQSYTENAYDFIYENFSICFGLHTQFKFYWEFHFYSMFPWGVYINNVGFCN